MKIYAKSLQLCKSDFLCAFSADFQVVNSMDQNEMGKRDKNVIKKQNRYRWGPLICDMRRSDLEKLTLWKKSPIARDTNA